MNILAYESDTAWNREIPCTFFKTLIQLYVLCSFLYYLTYCIKEVIKGKTFWRLNGEVPAHEACRNHVASRTKVRNWNKIKSTDRHCHKIHVAHWASIISLNNFMTDCVAFFWCHSTKPSWVLRGVVLIGHVQKTTQNNPQLPLDVSHP